VSRIESFAAPLLLQNATFDAFNDEEILSAGKEVGQRFCAKPSVMSDIGPTALISNQQNRLA
jgi:hypothetical protein